MIKFRLLTRYLLFFFTPFLTLSLNSQILQKVNISSDSGLIADSITISDSNNLLFKRKKPLLSFLIDKKNYTTGSQNIISEDSLFFLSVENKVKLTFSPQADNLSGWNCEFENISNDTVALSNVLPFEQSDESYNITGYGPDGLARACLFRPGFRPLRVILPDNAWELGYTSFSIDDEYSICGIARRRNTTGGVRLRYETKLPPGTKVLYSIYFEVFKGKWQEGLSALFREKYLYDTESFDNTLYERPDLDWIKQCYLIVLQMAWDREFFDRFTGRYTFPDVLRSGTNFFGNIDIYGIWPTWPRLGLDQRNQWDLYRDLPGGTAQLKNFVRLSHQSGTKFFIAYNPWDKSTRKEDHLKGMARLIKETEADGVVLDTQASSSYELQAAADSVKKGVIMYSEGMAVARDMQGIISGRVHNAIFLSPELNLNKFIKPDFSIFRVCDVGEDIIHREIAIAFFNGYGTELNLFRPGGRNENYRTDLEFLARTTMILRQNNDAFLDKKWIPLIDTDVDNLYVNQWQSGKKKIFTVLNMNFEGAKGRMLSVDTDSGKHYVSLWNHEIIIPEFRDGKVHLSVNADGWHLSGTGTRKEGSVDCIAEFPLLLKSSMEGDSVRIKSSLPGKLVIWKGNPSYDGESREIFIKADTVISVKDMFGFYEGKIVLQLLDGRILKDENVLRIEGGKPWLISKMTRTARAAEVVEGMVLVPGADFSYSVTPHDEFIPYPLKDKYSQRIDSFLIDIFPVTNEQYYEFISSSGYRPADTTRYLRHWEYGIYKPGMENFPVVYVSYDDIKAYAKWAGKRLPTEDEWQLAAQGNDKRSWPWGNEFHATLCNNAFGKTTPVDAFSKGASPYGVMDLVGNVWQVTNDLYFNGSYYFLTIRGGSHFRPESSWWYIQGGPQPLDRTQIMLLVSPGFDRSSTVGFRCVKDIDSGSFKGRK